MVKDWIEGMINLGACIIVKLALNTGWVQRRMRVEVGHSEELHVMNSNTVVTIRL